MPEITEGSMKPGDVFRSPNGNLFIVLPDGKQIYLGNTNFNMGDYHLMQFTTLPTPDSPAVKVIRIDPDLLWQEIT